MITGQDFVDVTIRRIVKKHTPTNPSFLDHVNDNLNDDQYEEKQLELLQNAMSECIATDIKNLFADLKYLRDDQAMELMEIITREQAGTIKHFRTKVNVDKALTGKG